MTDRLEPPVRRLQQAIEEAVLLLLPGGDIEFASQEAYQLLGCESSAELDARWFELRPALAAALESLGDEPGIPQHATLELTDGSYLTLELSRIDEELGGGARVRLRPGSPLDEGSSDRELAARLRATNRLFKTIRHDVRSPLNAASLFLQIVSESVTSDDLSIPFDVRDELDQHLDLIRSELGELDQFIQRFLAQALPPRDEAEEDLDLFVLVTEVCKRFQRFAKLNQFEIELRECRQLLRTRGRRNCLEQAFVHLILFLIDHVPGLDHIEIDLREEHEHCRVEISYRAGPNGSAPERSSSLAAQQTSDIGWAIARRGVESHGGELVLESELPRARVRLPRIP